MEVSRFWTMLKERTVGEEKLCCNKYNDADFVLNEKSLYCYF